jgi:hypothetical protein
MKAFIIYALLAILTTDVAFAECDFKTGIIDGPNKTFIYTEECHQKVGQLVQSNATQAAQIADYQKAITLKDLAITAADQRTQLWTKTAEDEQDRMNKLTADQNRSVWLYFGLGALTVIGAGFMTAKLIRP